MRHIFGIKNSKENYKKSVYLLLFYYTTQVVVHIQQCTILMFYVDVYIGTYV